MGKGIPYTVGELRKVAQQIRECVNKRIGDLYHAEIMEWAADRIEDDQPGIDLSLASTDELLEELKARYPWCVFTGLREQLGDKYAQERLCKWFGCTPTVVGLLDIAKARILQKLFTDMEPIKDNEDDLS